MKPENWPEILNEYIEDSRNKTFKWGETDCALWVADFILKIHGTDYAKDFRGKYKTEIGAYRAIKSKGYADLEALADKFANNNIIDVKMASRGDPIMLDNKTLGICNGVISHFLTHEGFINIPTETCKKAWKVE